MDFDAVVIAIELRVLPCLVPLLLFAVLRQRFFRRIKSPLTNLRTPLRGGFRGFDTWVPRGGVRWQGAVEGTDDGPVAYRIEIEQERRRGLWQVPEITREAWVEVSRSEHRQPFKVLAEARLRAAREDGMQVDKPTQVTVDVDSTTVVAVPLRTEQHSPTRRCRVGVLRSGDRVTIAGTVNELGPAVGTYRDGGEDDEGGIVMRSSAGGPMIVLEEHFHREYSRRFDYLDAQFQLGLGVFISYAIFGGLAFAAFGSVAVSCVTSFIMLLLIVPLYNAGARNIGLFHGAPISLPWHPRNEPATADVALRAEAEEGEGEEAREQGATDGVEKEGGERLRR